MMVKTIMPVIGNEAAAVRLPSSLGYCGMILCLLAFCRQRLSAVYAWNAALLACNACLEYSTEGRGYGVVLGCAACALLCWQAAVDGRRRMLAVPLLALCVALMTAMHYYSIFFLVPLCLAELVVEDLSKTGFGRLGCHGAGVARALASLSIDCGEPAIPDTFLVSCIVEQHSGILLRILCTYAKGVRAAAGCVGSDLDFGQPEQYKGVEPDSARVGSRWRPCNNAALCGRFVKIHYSCFCSPVCSLGGAGFSILVAALLCWGARGRVAVGVTLLVLLVAITLLRDARSDGDAGTQDN